jgi:2,4-dienoyl-CoA reductase-like NADH-dependent reductase (Old Yellow Enzyme family)
MSASGQLAARPFPLGGGLVLRNRLVGTAHAAGLVSDGLPLPGDAAYWRRRAAGGAAMLTVGGTVTAPESTWRRRIVTEAWREEAVPGMAARAEAIRGEGAVAACQLVHLGRETTGAEMWFPPVAPSAVRSPREPTRPRPLTDGEVDAIIEGFRVSAVNALAAGFQAIELHAAHGYLLGQFLSGVTNQRPGADSAAARAAIISRIATAIRGSAASAVIGIRLSTDGGDEAGLTLEGLCELLPHVSPAVDYVNLTVGVRTTYVRDMATAEPPLLPLLPRVRPLARCPLIVSQAFRRAEQVEAALAAGADLVGMARPLIADPDLPAKLLSGREREVRPCVSCNEDCRAFDPVLLCSVNPELAPDGMTRRPAAPLLVRQPAAPRGEAGGTAARVAIVGAGPAGLECATALAGLRETVIFEARDVIGGQLAVAAAAPNRGGWRALLDFYRASLDDADGVTMRLGENAGAEDLAGFGEIVLAVGGEEVLPGVPGIERARTASAAIAAGPSALAGREHLLIVDDGFGYWPCASAVELGVRAAVPKITVATPGAAFGASLPSEGRVQLLARLRGAPLTVLAFTALSAVGNGFAELAGTMSETVTRLDADAVIVVGERRARDWRPLVPGEATVRVIGDALVPRRVAHAVSEGRAAAEAILARRPQPQLTA